MLCILASYLCPCTSEGTAWKRTLQITLLGVMSNLSFFLAFNGAYLLLANGDQSGVCSGAETPIEGDTKDTWKQTKPA